MLVLSRKENQKILFPDLGITVSLLQVSRKHARIGVEAPRDVAVLRGELSRADARERIDAMGPAHQRRNLMNTINLYAMLYQQQIQAGLVDAAHRTMIKLVDFLDVKSKTGAVEFEVDGDQPELGGHVMVVEDDQNQRELLQSLLEMHGVQVTGYEDGKRAFDDLRLGLEPDVILMDWSMEQYDGAWLSTQVAKEFGPSRPRMFVVSGSDRMAGDEASYVDAWLSKPLNRDLLIARLRAVGLAA